MKIISVDKVENVPTFELITYETDQVVAAQIERAGFWEPIETCMMRQLVEEGNTVLDIGANIGYYSILFSKVVGDQGEIHSFEPFVDNHKLLFANTIINDCHNVTTYQKAVGALNGKTDLYISEENNGDHQLFASDGRVPVTAEVISIDQYFSDKHIDFIKIDTQGSEFNILKGMQETIKHNRKHLSMMLEFCPNLLQKAGSNVEELISLLVSLDAQAFSINPPKTSVYVVNGSLHSEQLGLASKTPQVLKEMFNNFLSEQHDIFCDLIIFFSEEAIARHSAKFNIEY